MASNYIFIFLVASIVDVLYLLKGLLSNEVFRVFWSSGLKCVLDFFQASFIYSPFPILLMCACHDVSRIPVSTNHSWWAAISLKIFHSTMFRALFMFMSFRCAQEGQKGLQGTWVHFERLKGWRWKALGLCHALVHSREGGSQVRVCDASLKNRGEGFRLRKCIVHSRERWRALCALLKAKGWGL